MRLNQYLSKATGLSRRSADAEIASGRVLVDGHPASLGEQVSVDSKVILNGRAVGLPSEYVYLILYKPVGYVTSRKRQGLDPTIYELLPDKFSALKPAGRLDKDSSGLVLLSNDGDFIYTNSHPSATKLKTYELVLTQPLSTADKHALASGVELEDGPSHLGVTRAHGPNITVTLTEGRNRQIRRTLGALGYGIKSLHRTSIGHLGLGTLRPGQWQEFKEDPA